MALPNELTKALQEIFKNKADCEKFIVDAIYTALQRRNAECQKKEKEDKNKHSAKIIQNALLYTDGGSRGNPGPAAIGCILKDKNTKQIIDQKLEYIGTETNNIAEYKALLTGLQLAKKNNVQNIHCYTDSELVAKQVQGVYKIKEQKFWPFIQEIRSLLENMHGVISAIPREKNAEADALVNKALDHHRL